jgi:NIMA (never in mitosis gene a)-related kinase
VPGHFSKNIPNLLSAMLNKDPSKRPNINGILKFPIIQERIKMLLNEDDFKDEFSHTILHNQNVFDDFRAKQAEAKAKAADDKAKAQELAKKEKELADQMAQL